MSIFNQISGTDGKVVIKGLGSLVGEVASWSLAKPEEGRKKGYSLVVKFAFVVPSLLMDPDYNDGREMHLQVGKKRTIRVPLDNPERMALMGKILRMEGVEIEWLVA